MRISQLLMAVAVTAMTITASAEPKCNHRKENSLFANTNPVVKQAVKSVKTDSSTKTGNQ
jgi:hypothetical protein